MNQNTHSWVQSALSIAAIFAFRMLGLFMLIPVFTVYASKLEGATPVLIGIALGSYGLSQGLLQIPFGLLSDRFGRKSILTLGLLLFAAGSIVGACSHSIHTSILARILQGSGAIGSVLMALLADVTDDKERMKAMAVIGVIIGLSFSVALVISPAIAWHFGLSGIFWFTALLAGLGLLLLHTIVPTPHREPFQQTPLTYRAKFMLALKNTHLQRLNFGIFCQHLILTATFFAIPLILQQHIAEKQLTQQWHFYLPLMVVSFLGMLPLMVLAERKHKMKLVFLISILVTGLIQWVLAFTAHNWFSLCASMLIYFVVFNFLEASLPSLVSRQAHLENKGTAMGIYSSSQFLGIFAGGLLAGLVFQKAGSAGIFMVNGVLAFIWFVVGYKMQPNVYQLTLSLSYAEITHDLQKIEHNLRALRGVKQVVFEPDEQMVYLRIDKSQYQEGSAEILLS